MSLIPPTELPYGPLVVEEVYFQHDGPRFFAVRSERWGMRLLALCVDEDELDQSVTYIYLALSQARFQQVRSGRISLRQAFDLAQSGDVWQVTADYLSDPPENHVEQLAAVPEEWLPDADAFLDLPTATAPDFRPEELGQEARESQRSLMAVELDPAEANTTELRLRVLGRVATSLQDTLDAMAQEEQGERTVSGAIKAEITSEVQMSVYGLRAASFVLLLGIDREGKLFERADLVSGTLGRLVTLVESASSADTLLPQLQEYGPRVRGRFRQLLQNAVEAGSGLAVHAAPLTTEQQAATLNREQVRSALTTIADVSPDVREILLPRVALTALNTHRHTFEVWDSVQGSRYSGVLSPEAREQVDGSRVGTTSFYSVKIEVQTDFASTEGSPIEKYRLLEINPLDG